MIQTFGNSVPHSKQSVSRGEWMCWIYLSETGVSIQILKTKYISSQMNKNKMIVWKTLY